MAAPLSDPAEHLVLEITEIEQKYVILYPGTDPDGLQFAGLTGWAQVNCRDEIPIPQKVALDAEYLVRRSFWFDIKILWLTFVKVLRRDGVTH